MAYSLRDDRWDEVVAIVQRRLNQDPERITEMIRIRDRYDGDFAVPLPDVENEPNLPAPVPHLMADAIDQTAMRAASVQPAIEVPAITRGKERGVRSDEYAAIRRRRHYATWDYSALPLLMFRAFRHYAAYGSSALEAVPDFEDNRARVVLRDPLTSYPEEREPEDVRPPKNIAYVYGRSTSWLMAQYPDDMREVGERFRGEMSDDVLWDVFEWQDADEVILGLLGPREQGRSSGGPFERGEQPVLNEPFRRKPNRAGICTSYVPFRVTLDRVMGQVAKMLDLDELWARMMALDVVAAEKSIFSDKYVVSDESGTPRIVSNDGRWADGREGQINIVTGAKQLGLLQEQPGPGAQAVIDRIERAGRITGGAIPQFSGETPGAALRTGRAIDAMTSFALDPRIQEMHVVAQYMLRSINTQAMAVEEGWWPKRKFFVFSGWPSDKGFVKYRPTDHFETKEGGRANAVSYPFPGADGQVTAVMIGHRVAMKTMSTRTAAIKDPFIDDADLEAQQRMEEQLEQAAGVGFAQQVASGEIELDVTTAALEAARKGVPIEKVIEAAQTAAREKAERQRSEQAASGTPALEGALQPASVAEQARAAQRPAPGPVPGPAPPQERLRQLASALQTR